ncbi:hypothetical protein LSAT2_021504 [Lamellibrachia satsuma]|nr:hypothetical protein LSAT2_021504 [Lamellibrachia satsuma]
MQRQSSPSVLRGAGCFSVWVEPVISQPADDNFHKDNLGIHMDQDLGGCNLRDTGLDNRHCSAMIVTGGNIGYVRRLSQHRYWQLVADDSNSYIWQYSVCCRCQVTDKEPAGDVIDNGADVHIVYADMHANPGLVLLDLDGSPYTINAPRAEQEDRLTPMDMEMGEASMLDPEPIKIARPIASLTYHTVREGSQKGKVVLVKSDNLVEEAYRQTPVGTSLPNPENLACRAYRVRAAVRPRNPDNLDFHLNEDFVPDSFLRGDIRVDDRRHLLFASDRLVIDFEAAM